MKALKTKAAVGKILRGGQLTVPKSIRRDLELQKGDLVQFTVSKIARKQVWDDYDRATQSLQKKTGGIPRVKLRRIIEAAIRDVRKARA